MLGYRHLSLIRLQTLQVEGGFAFALSRMPAMSKQPRRPCLKVWNRLHINEYIQYIPEATEDGTIKVTFNDHFDYSRLRNKTIVMEYDARLKTG